MFPHMYKVRPSKSQLAKTPSIPQQDSPGENSPQGQGMATDCDWRGDGWRKNRWSRQSVDEGIPSTNGPCVTQLPPAGPIQPTDGQENLNKETPVRRRTRAPDTTEIEENKDLGTPSLRRRRRSRTDSPAKQENLAETESDTPTRKRIRSRAGSQDMEDQGQNGHDTTVPTIRRRMRSRPDISAVSNQDTTENGINDENPSIRKRTRSRTRSPAYFVQNQADKGENMDMGDIQQQQRTSEKNSTADGSNTNLQEDSPLKEINSEDKHKENSRGRFPQKQQDVTDEHTLQNHESPEMMKNPNEQSQKETEEIDLELKRKQEYEEVMRLVLQKQQEDQMKQNDKLKNKEPQNEMKHKLRKQSTFENKEKEKAFKEPTHLVLEKSKDVGDFDGKRNKESREAIHSTIQKDQEKPIMLNRRSRRSFQKDKLDYPRRISDARREEKEQGLKDGPKQTSDVSHQDHQENQDKKENRNTDYSSPEIRLDYNEVMQLALQKQKEKEVSQAEKLKGHKIHGQKKDDIKTEVSAEKEPQVQGQSAPPSSEHLPKENVETKNLDKLPQISQETSILKQPNDKSHQKETQQQIKNTSEKEDTQEPQCKVDYEEVMNLALQKQQNNQERKRMTAFQNQNEKPISQDLQQVTAENSKKLDDKDLQNKLEYEEIMHLSQENQKNKLSLNEPQHKIYQGSETQEPSQNKTEHEQVGSSFEAQQEDNSLIYSDGQSQLEKPLEKGNKQSEKEDNNQEKLLDYQEVMKLALQRQQEYQLLDTPKPKQYNLEDGEENNDSKQTYTQDKTKEKTPNDLQEHVRKESNKTNKDNVQKEDERAETVEIVLPSRRRSKQQQNKQIDNEGRKEEEQLKDLSKHAAEEYKEINDDNLQKEDGNAETVEVVLPSRRRSRQQQNKETDNDDRKEEEKLKDLPKHVSEEPKETINEKEDKSDEAVEVVLPSRRRTKQQKEPVEKDDEQLEAVIPVKNTLDIPYTRSRRSRSPSPCEEWGTPSENWGNTYSNVPQESLKQESPQRESDANNNNREELEGPQRQEEVFSMDTDFNDESSDYCPNASKPTDHSEEWNSILKSDIENHIPEAWDDEVSSSQPLADTEENDEDNEEDIDYENAMKKWLQASGDVPDWSESTAIEPEIINYKVQSADDDWLNQDAKKKDVVVDEWYDEDNKNQERRRNFSKSPQRQKVDTEPVKNWWETDSVDPENEEGRHIPRRSVTSLIPWWEGSRDKDIPAPPPAPPGPPPPPMPPPLPGTQPVKRKPLKAAQLRLLESIKKASRTRPDWNSLMKDLEGGKAVKLKHVSTPDVMDRSMPILPKSRGKNGKYVYESEKPNAHNQLLRDIQTGVRLRHTKTNDRSKPDFSKLGLKKLRRQVTREDIEKKKSPIDTLPSSSDEEEDIDKMRDDLQATKTQLSDEIKKTMKLQRSEKILKIDIESLEAEVKKLKKKLKEAGIVEPKILSDVEANALVPKLSKSMSKLRMKEEDLDFSDIDEIESEVSTLNEQIEAQRKRAERAEQRVEEMERKMQVAASNESEWEMRAIFFEKKYKALQKDQGIELPDVDCKGVMVDPADIAEAENSEIPETIESMSARRSASRKSLGSVFGRMESFAEEENEDSLSSEEEESDGDSVVVDENYKDDSSTLEESTSGEDDEERERREERNRIKKEKDMVFWKNRLGHMKEKEKNVRKERNNLRERLKKFYRDSLHERMEYLRVKGELNELTEDMKEADESEEEPEYESDDEEEVNGEMAPDEDDGGFWFEDEPRKPKKLKKRKKKKQLTASGEFEEVESEDDEDLEIVDSLQEPVYEESDYYPSGEDDEEDDLDHRLSMIQTRARSHENTFNTIKKGNYLLKSQIDQAQEMYAAEKRRHFRLDNELQILLTSI